LHVNDLDLPERARQILQGLGYGELYPPQAEAIPKVLAGESLVLAAPTASGKSLVAYCACLKHVLSGGKAIYVVPLRALASEKQEDLSNFEPLGIKVAYSAGDFDGPDPNLERYDIIVATSEKADSLMRHKSRWLDDLTLMVADEVHLLHDMDRGPTLEVTLAKFRRSNPKAQVVALSATIGNSKEIADWLKASHVRSSWRPIPLKEGYHLEGVVRFTDNTVREIRQEAKDELESLVLDTLAEGGQCLVFVNTRRSSESVAEKLGKRVRKHLSDEALEKLATFSKRLGEAQDEPTSFGDRLATCAANGAAFHNAGLANSQRKAVERAFKDGVLKCLVATPTLAAGINLPARRVIVRDVHRYDANFGNVPLPALEVKQMCGRAGRPQYDPYGEAVIMARSKRDGERIQELYLFGDTEPVESKLMVESALRTHVLATIATGFADTFDGLNEFIGSTFFAHQRETWEISENLEKALTFLDENGLVVWTDESLRATAFGRRTSDLYIDPMSAVKLKEALDSGVDKPSELAILHAVCSTPDVPTLYMRAKDDWVAGSVPEDSKFLVKPEGEEDFFMAEIKTALLLSWWLDERTEGEITERFDIGPGDIRSRVDTGEWVAYSFRELARLFGSPMLGSIDDVVLRLRKGIKAELLDLARLRGVGRVRARMLWNSGLRSAADIAKCEPARLAALPGMGERLAQTLVEQARKV
jgi:helicase